MRICATFIGEVNSKIWNQMKVLDRSMRIIASDIVFRKMIAYFKSVWLSESIAIPGIL